jgi:uncharacterized sulfatase
MNVWRSRLSRLLVVAAVVGLGPHAAWGRVVVRPNVVVILVDDLGWSDLSCFGGEPGAMPHIDRLAGEGVRFRSFYANAPICSPSRVALLTGQYPHRWGITSYLDNRAANKARGMANWLDARAPVLARELKRAGYRTGHFGKWHMGGQRDVGDAPDIADYGFDRSLTNFEGLGPRVLPLCDAGDARPPRRHDLGSAALGRGPIQWHDRSSITTTYVDAALSCIDDATSKDEPFFINLWLDDVHSPFYPPGGPRGRGKRADYLAVLEAMDAQLATLFSRLRDDKHLLRNTLVMLLSDNGPEDRAGSSQPLRAGKGWLYEGGIRSPLIVWAPGLMAADAIGTVNDRSVFCSLDLVRSLYSLTSTPLPEGASLDGEDVSATLLGQAATGRDSPICWRRPPDRPGTKQEDNPDLAVRAGRWKYCVNEDGSRPQLFDLSADASEDVDVAAKEPETVARLHRAVMEWDREMRTSQ